MIIDCILFGGELDILELHLKILDDAVDWFVLVEARQTHAGQRKPLFYAEHKERFHRWSDRIVHVVLDELPADELRKRSEIFQRNSLLRGLDKLPGLPDDVVIVADVDEIPFPEAVDQAAAMLRKGASSIGFDLATSRFYGNWIDTSVLFPVTKAFRRDALSNPHHQRYRETPDAVLPAAGRHISTLLTPDETAGKLGRYAHVELDNARDASPVHLQHCRTYAVEMAGIGLLAQLPPQEWDVILRGLVELRPNLVHTAPLPPLKARQRYLTVTRARKLLSPESRLLPFVDRHAESSVLAACARLVLALTKRPRLWFEHRTWVRFSRERDAILAEGTCSPWDPCDVCLRRIDPNIQRAARQS
ncbi:MAG TPA: hypothetical protein VGH52_01005 [Gaiellaceae bacterium]